jgi:Disulfide bond formation protein DsbB
MAIQSSSAPPDENASSVWTWLALLIALIGLAGTLWLSVGMELIACPLCFYQRTCIMAVVGVLLMGLVAGPRRAGFLSLVTLPVTVAGLGVAGFHVYREWDNKLDCPDGAIPFVYKEVRGPDDFYKKMHELVTAPKESLTVFALLFLVQLVDVLRSGKRGGFGFGAVIPALLLGGLFSAGMVYSVKDHREITRPTEGCISPAQQDKIKKERDKRQELEREIERLSKKKVGKPVEAP